MLDTAPLKRIWRTHAVDGDPTVGELDPPMLRRHRMGQRSHVRFQQDPFMLKRRHSVLQQTAVRAAQLPTIQSTRLPL